MKGATQSHPTSQQLAAFGLGQLPPEESARVERHVATCDTCCRALAAVPDDTLIERLRAGDTPTHAEVAGHEPLPPELAEHARYRVVRVLGTGGMGVVYQAEHRMMERVVALKVIRGDLLRRPQAVERFQTEVRAAARLAHPNIVTAHDAEQAGSIHFLVMEYVDGVSLYRLVKERGPLPIAEACEYIRQAAMGLQHAFERGMVHRDIKPHNLMRTPQGQVKILDFGLARLGRDAGPEEAFTSKAKVLTAAETVLGTPDYMAPEQAVDSHAADIRADIYSLGATLYFLLTGRAPFAGTSFLPDQRTPPSLAKTRPDAPAALGAVAERMMAVDPAKRYQVPREVILALAPFAHAPAPSLVGRSPGWRRRRALIAVGVLAAAIGLVWAVAGPFRHPRRQAVSDNRPVVATGKVLCVLAQKFDREGFVPVESLLRVEGGRKVVVASSAASPCVPQDGLGQPVKPEVVITEDLRAGDYDAIVFVGGYIWEFKDNTDAARVVARLIREMAAADKPVAALGGGQRILAAHGTLKGRKAASCSMVRQEMPDCGAQWQNQPVVEDGPIITGADTKDAWAFARALLKKLRRG